jgi:hypothetical protein
MATTNRRIILRRHCFQHARPPIHPNCISYVAYTDPDCHIINDTGAYTHAPIDPQLLVEYSEAHGKRGPIVIKLKGRA